MLWKGGSSSSSNSSGSKEYQWIANDLKNEEALRLLTAPTLREGGGAVTTWQQQKKGLEERDCSACGVLAGTVSDVQCNRAVEAEGPIHNMKHC